MAANPSDVHLLQKLGELFERAGEVESAAKIFARVALQYGIEGHFLKAIALIKQALKMEPGLLAAREALAGWYAALSLDEEATTEYRTLLGHYRVLEAADDAARIMDALGRLGASIDPGSGRA